MFLTASKRCKAILLALSIVLLILAVYRDEARKVMALEKQRSIKDVLTEESTRGSGNSTSLSAAVSQNINTLDKDVFMETNFNGGANKHDKRLQNYSRVKINELGSENTSKTAHPTTNTTSSVHLTTAATASSTKPKTILFYTKVSQKWSERLKENTASLMDKCPISNCVFLEKSAHPEEADAVIFHVLFFNPESVPAIRRPDQIYVWLSLEAPTWPGFNMPRPGRSHKNLGKIPTTSKSFGRPGFFNWTCTYHRESDVMHPYGGLLPLKGEADYVRPGLLKKYGAVYREFMAALDRGDKLEDEAFLSRPKLVAWMVSHCSTLSGREHYVKELRQHIQVDVYGSCGDLKCDKKQRRWCYRDVLMPNYKFYLAFENSLCEDYATEKMWNPLHDGMVPVVYGGVQYSDILPPHSYVDATKLTPLQLANLLSSIASSPQLYGRYHLWRKYWKVVLTPPLCELCVKLHTKAQEGSNGGLRHQSHHNLTEWWWNLNKCTSPYP